VNVRHARLLRRALTRRIALSRSILLGRGPNLQRNVQDAPRVLKNASILKRILSLVRVDQWQSLVTQRLILLKGHTSDLVLVDLALSGGRRHLHEPFVLVLGLLLVGAVGASHLRVVPHLHRSRDDDQTDEADDEQPDRHDYGDQQFHPRLPQIEACHHEQRVVLNNTCVNNNRARARCKLLISKLLITIDEVDNRPVSWLANKAKDREMIWPFPSFQGIFLAIASTVKLYRYLLRARLASIFKSSRVSMLIYVSLARENCCSTVRVSRRITKLGIR